MLNIKRLVIKTAMTVALLTSVSSQAANLCDQVWNGTVERVRIQEQSNGTTVVRLYLHPGNNSDYAGYTASPFMVTALQTALANNAEITGYTDSSCKIAWVDFK